ncbi:DUF4340 domain-containing protein [Pseudoflavonifractor sp. MCC625]|uniref:DUF4340 domain-containing protein n=1 Tax=Pseudoflavonifractor sp. MCC625 TaxID=2592647 RepID=UPI001C02404D|nr:DUF4340 domain-containing protein [Pseudoflavonifractor sp. MCC625]MBT9684304.1 DUF4340 domain-containing protein [Pseudoflavonifractor sp. MCC625]
MKRAKRLYVLLGVLVVVCIAAFAVVKHEERQEEIRNSGEIVLEIDPETVDALSWEYESESLAFHKDETWQYDEDAAFPVSEEKIQELLEPFQALEAAFIIEEVTDYSQYGLDNPVCTIHLSAGEEDYEIKLGNYSTMDSQRYLSTGDGNVYLVEDDPMEDYEITIRDMIANDETPSFGQVTGIQFEGADSYQVVYQEYSEESPYTYCSEDVYFRQEGEDLKPLDTNLVESYLSGIENLTLDNYMTYQAGTEDLSQYGLDAPELTVTVTYTPEEDEEGESQTFTLHISRSPEERAAAENDTASEEDEEEEITAYARVGDSEIVYQITGESYEKLIAAGYDDLRHKEALTADFTQVTGLDITLEGTVYNLTSEGSGEDKTFRFGEEEVDVADLQSALEGLTADSFTQEEPTQKEEIALTVYLDSEVHPSVQIQLYRYDGENCLAVIDGEPVSLIPRSAVVDLIEAVNAIVL